MMGSCGLCLQTKELQMSHLLPAALYKQFRDPFAGSDPNPVVISNKRALTSSKQISSPFLCAGCEARLSVNGENYVMTQCVRRRGQFKLRKLLKTATPLCVIDEKEIEVYDVRSLLKKNIDRYLYFAASIFWRASAHDWKMGNKKVGGIRLGGEYQEQFRVYLLGEAGFPQNARIHVHVSSETTVPLSAAAIPTTYRLDRAHRHKFYIPGVLFILFLGYDAAVRFDNLALNGSNRNIMVICPWLNDSLFHGMQKIMAEATPTGRLRK